MNKMNLIQKLIVELDRVKIVKSHYEEAGRAGEFALQLIIRPAIKLGESCLILHDAVDCIRALKELESISE